MGEIEKLAHEIDKWWEDYDHYGYNDAFSGEEEGYMAVIDGLYNYPDDLCEQLQDSLDDLRELDGTVDPFNQDLYDRGVALIDKVKTVFRLESVKNMKPQRRLKESIGDGSIKAWIGNLGKYNEGELVGEWVTLPVSKSEYEEVLKRIGIGSTDDFGSPYEETFVADYDDPYGFIFDEYGEYPSIKELNAVAMALDDMKDWQKELLEAMIEVGYWSFWECLGNALEGSCSLIEGDSWEDFAYWYVDEVYGGVENLPSDTLEEYFDYEALGRDLGFDSYENPDDPDGDHISAGEYWCGDENATDEEIGEAFVEAVGFDGVANPENYFDYKEFGRNFSFDEIDITDKGILDYANFDTSLGEDVKEKYLDEVESDWGEDLEESLKESSAYGYFDDAQYSSYKIKFEDGYELIVIGNLEDVLFAVDKHIAEHGECIECLKEISHDRYTGSKYEKVW